MKDKLIIFIIGVLVGAVICTGAFYVYTTTTNNTDNQGEMMQGGTPPQMPNGETPPEKPSGDNTNPPEMPNNNTQENN